VHLCWLSRTLSEPELVLHNFYANWLDAFGSAFYRPLVSVSLYFDYLIWHNNGLGFHITNLLFHYVSVAFIYLFAQEIQIAASTNPDPLLGKLERAHAGAASYLCRSSLPDCSLCTLFIPKLFPGSLVASILSRLGSSPCAFIVIRTGAGPNLPYRSRSA